ncbi:MAG TPA: aryl-sulfate sulfotransferase [Acidobacteriaceae bacterium]|nr:aryl-sulfate sulfotransferase [Acidobacteriaceae bacterium]
MKHPFRTGVSAVLSLLFVLLAAGCGVTLGAPEQQPPPQGPPTQPPPGQPPPASGGSGVVTISPEYVALSPGQTTHFTATGGSPLTWLVNGVSGGNASVGTVDASGDYTAPATLPQSANFSVTAELTSSPQQNNATAVASVIDPGVVYPTANPQVVQYSIYLPAPGNVAIQFGPTTGYGFNTWQVATPTADGGQVSIYVAGMLARTLYHMRAQVALNDGASLNDPDHDHFASGASLVTGSPPLTSPVTITSSGTPQPGIEMWNTILPEGDSQAFATDLQGNVIWTYSYQGTYRDFIQGIQLLPSGNLLMVISYLSSLPQVIVNETPGTLNEIREVDLAGNTVSDLTMDELNLKLAAAGFHDSDGSNYQLKSFHHWVLPLPNGHMVLLASYPKNFTALPDAPGVTTVLGDVLVDVDQNLNPDWVWSAFDHLDVNRHPMNFPDWTHSNDMIYSSDDHNLLLSIRHQNWIIKIDFDDGEGSGDVLWRLGYQGDFQLLNSAGQPDNNPADWFYAQHGLNYFTPNTTGVFRLGLMDNGNDRIFAPPTGQVFCKTTGTAQCYSTLPVLEINETNMTATLVTHYVPPPSYYNYFGGNVEMLGNGDIHGNFCAAASGSIVQELDPTGSQVVWQGTTPNANQFRVDRLPSLYPGVQW